MVEVARAAYRRVTRDLTLAVAGTLGRLDPGMTFVYVSGAGTDGTARGRSMWVPVEQAGRAAIAVAWHGVAKRVLERRDLDAVR